MEMTLSNVSSTCRLMRLSGLSHGTKSENCSTRQPSGTLLFALVLNQRLTGSKKSLVVNKELNGNSVWSVVLNKELNGRSVWSVVLNKELDGSSVWSLPRDELNRSSDPTPSRAVLVLT